MHVSARWLVHPAERAQISQFLRLSAPCVCVLVTHFQSLGSTLKQTPPEQIIKQKDK